MQKSCVNKVILVGHLGNNPEGRYTPSGSSTASFSLATNEVWLDSENSKQEKVEWHNIVAWNKLADFATEYLAKGQLVYIEGRIQSRSYIDKEKNKRWITEIISTRITPLEWKSLDKDEGKGQGNSNNSDNKEVNNDGENLPF